MGLPSGKVFNRAISPKYVVYEGELITPETTQVKVLSTDSSGDILFATGTTVPTNNESGYAKGCLFIDTDVGAGSTGIYENVGTTTDCNFDTIGSGGGGVTAFTGLSDVPNSYSGAGDKIVKVNSGATALEFVAVSGDVAMNTAGVMTVTDLTITSEAQGDILIRGASAWQRLAAGTSGYVLKTQGAAANPIWVDPATLPTGIASGLAQTFSIEGGTYDIAVTNTTQTVGAVSLTIPDFASVADTFAFITLAQTFANKTLTTPVIASFYQDAGKTKLMTTPNTASDTLCAIAATQTLTNKTLSGNVATGFVYSAGGNAITFQNAIHTVIGRDTTDTLTNKTLTDTTCILGANGALTKTLGFDLSALTAGNKLTLAAAAGTAQTLTLPNATDTLVGKATTDTLTNKSLDCDGSGNALTNVNANELDSITGNTYGIPFIIQYNLSNQAAAVNIFNANAPFKLKVIRAWSISTSADGGTWKLNNGALGAGTDLSSAITVDADSGDLDEMVEDIESEANRTIAQNGSLSIVPDVGGALDCLIYVECLRVD